MTRRNGDTEDERAMPLDRATPQLASRPLTSGLAITAPLYPSRAKRVTGMASPFLRSSVVGRFLRRL